MRLKIRCNGESWKILGFWVEVNKALVRWYAPVDSVPTYVHVKKLTKY